MFCLVQKAMANLNPKNNKTYSSMVTNGAISPTSANNIHRLDQRKIEGFNSKDQNGQLDKINGNRPEKGEDKKKKK